MQAERGNRALRTLDRYVGIPLVAVGGLVKRRRQLPRQIRRIGLLNGTAIGDTVLLSAVARDIAASHAPAETILFSSPANIDFLRTMGEFAVAPISIHAPAEAIRAIRSAEVDVVLDFDAWPRIEAVYCMFSGAAFCAGFRSPAQYRHYCYDETVEHSQEMHVLDNFRRLAAVLGVESRSLPRLEPRGAVTDHDLPPHPYVVFHLWPAGYRSELKEWPAARWRELARHFRDRGYTIAVTGSREDASRSQAFVSSVPGAVNVAGRYDLGQLPDVFARSSCVISVNTGVMHMAAATGVPTVALNGPTAALRWGPVGERVASVNSTFAGCGYLNFGWEYNGHRTDCMAGIAVDDVFASALDVMGET